MHRNVIYAGGVIYAVRRHLWNARHLWRGTSSMRGTSPMREDVTYALQVLAQPRVMMRIARITSRCDLE
jgi:hypothetical protein